MAGSELFLGSRVLDAVHPVEIAQRPVFADFSKIHAAILRQCGPDVATLFAEPIFSRGNGQAPARVDWYTGLVGKVASLSAVDPGTAVIVREKLSVRLNELRAVQAPSHDAALVAAALNVFSSSSIMCVGDDPVIVNWGMLPKGVKEPADRDAHFRFIFGLYLVGAPTPPISLEEWELRSQTPGFADATLADATLPAAGDGVGAGNAASIASEQDGCRHPSRRAAMVACVGAGAALLLLAIPGVLRFSPTRATAPGADVAAASVIETYERRQRLLRAAMGDPCGAHSSTEGQLLVPPAASRFAFAFDEPSRQPQPWPRAGEAIAPGAPSPAAAPLSPGANEPGDLASRIEGAVVLVVAGESIGSGFFITPELIVTNQHVTGDAASVFVASKSVGILPATIVGRGREDEARDFALLRVAPQASLVPFELAVPAAPLSPVIAAGFPGLYLATDPVFQQLKSGDRGAVRALSPIFQSGIVSHLQRHPEAGTTLVLHSAEISPGSSGGPLVDYCGRVIGVNTFLRTNRQIAVTARYALGVDGLKRFVEAFGVSPALATNACVPRLTQAAASPQPPRESHD